MKPKFILPLTLIFLWLCSCSKSDDNAQDNTLPEAVNLVFPQNNSECNEGEVIDDEESKVTFQWNASLNADFYVFLLEGLSSDFTYEAETDETEIAVTIKRGEAYSWRIISRSSISKENTSSETWNFYNAGSGITAHVPFPAEILNPKAGEILSSDTANVLLEWSGNDLDGDLAGYEIYFGQENPPINKHDVGPEATLEVSVTSGNTYYWYVVTTDEKNNASISGVVNFVVE